MKEKIHRQIDKFIQFTAKKPYIVLVMAAVLVGISILPIKNIRLDSDLDDLLPRNTPTIEAMEETNRRYGSADLFTIAIQLNDAEELAKIQDEIKERIEKEWDDARYVQVKRDNSFFMKHALLYLPIHHLEHIVNNLSDIQNELGRKRHILVADLIEEAAKEDSTLKEKRKWFDASIPQELGLPDEAAKAFSGFLKSSEPKKEKESEEKKEVFDPKKNIPEHLKNRLMGWHGDGTLNAVVQTALKNPSSDKDYVQTVLDRTQKIIEPYQKKFGKDIDIGVEGSYRSLSEVKNLQTNGIIATSVSIVLIVVIILVFFRSFGAVLAILFQVGFSITYTMGMTGIIYGRLNLYTTFVMAILLGMGIDYSIHIMGHAQKEAQKGKSWQEALSHTLKILLHPILLAAITTIAGLLTLLSAKFVGFYEFGVIASMGIVFSVITSITLLPSFVFTFEKFKNIPGLKILSLPTKPVKPIIPWHKIDWPKRLKVLATAILIGSIGLIFFAGQAGFEHDFKNLRDTKKGKPSKRHTGVAISSNRKSSQPIVALANDPQTLVALHDTLLHRLGVEKDPMLRSFLTLSTFVPPEDRQEDRMEVIEEISDLVSARVFSKATGKDSSMIQKLRDMVDVEVFGPGDIPKWALRLVLEKDNTYGKIGFIYGNFRSSDAHEAGKFQDRYGKFTLNNEDIKLFSSAFIYSDIIRMVEEDSLKMSWLISLIIILTLILTLRKFNLIIISTICLALGILWTVGLMGLVNFKLGPFNLIVVPTILGVSVDSIIHLLIAYKRYGRNNLSELYSTTGSLVTASVVTTLAGYAGMLIVTHKGIGSIGQLAILGFSACLLIALFITPWLCSKLIRK